MTKHSLLWGRRAGDQPFDADAAAAVDLAAQQTFGPAPDLSRRLSRRERAVEGVFALAFGLTAMGLATVADTRPSSLVLAAALVAFYAVAGRITFEVGAGFTVPTQLVLVPMLFLLPAAIVPLLVAAGLVFGSLPDRVRRRVGIERGIADVADAWHAVGPALVFLAADIREPAWGDWPFYVTALAAQFAFDLGTSVARERAGRGLAAGEQLRALGWVYLVDTLLAPIGLLAAVAADDRPYAIVLLVPLLALLGLFGKERSARIEQARALSRAYRGAALDLRKRLEELRESDERFRLLVSSVKDYAIVMLDSDGRVTSWNQGAERIQGYSADEVMGEHVALFYLPADLERGAPERELQRAIAAQGWEEEGWRRRKDGSGFFAHVVTTPLLGDDGQLRGFATVMRDVTERNQLEAELARRALHDPLTDLPNRDLFLEHLRAALGRSERRESLTAVLFADLDRFKWVNDSLGHGAGDHVLVEVARRLQGAVRAGDTVARLGGDEFTVLCEDISERYSILIAERISAALRRPFRVEGEDVFLDVSVGIAFATGPDSDSQTLLRNADAAMYRVKRRSGAGYAVYDKRMRSNGADRLRMESALRRAIDRGELRVFYQPQIDLHTGALVGAEALVRWARGRELVAPARFIPLAEETGLIHPIGDMVLRHACHQAARWKRFRTDGRPLRIAVNVAAAQLVHPGLRDRVEEALAVSGAEAAGLCIEITESALIGEADAAVGVLTALTDLGVDVAIDDFGKGYSSLSYLSRFPVHVLKVDGSFITRLGDAASDAALVSAVTHMGHALDLTVVAECVETALQVDRLTDAHCDLAQGYYFARPEPAETLDAMLSEGRRWPAERP